MELQDFMFGVGWLGVLIITVVTFYRASRIPFNVLLRCECLQDYNLLKKNTIPGKILLVLVLYWLLVHGTPSSATCSDCSGTAVLWSELLFVMIVSILVISHFEKEHPKTPVLPNLIV